MYVKRIIGVYALTVLLAGCGSPKVESQLSSAAMSTESVTLPMPETIADPNTSKRQAAFTSWKEATRLVADKTGDGEAQKLADFLRYNSALAEPTEQGARILTEAEVMRGQSLITRNPVFLFIPLIAGDELSGDTWKKIATAKTHAASFEHDIQAMVVRSTPSSQLWRGILGLHEISHAYAAAQRSTHVDQDKAAYVEEEFAAHELENRLMAKLGGKAYRAIVDQEVERLKEEVRKVGQEVGGVFPRRASNFPGLDTALSRSLSEEERSTRATHVWIAACFLLIDRHYNGVDKERCKIRFLTAMYEQGGILK